MKWLFSRWWVRCFGWWVGLSLASLSQAEMVEYAGARYFVYRVPPADFAKLQLVWLDSHGNPLENFTRLREVLTAQGKRLRFATNGGIYERGPKPCGLAVVDGVEVHELNLREDEGNFYLKPNGVFYVDQEGRAGVMESEEYARSGVSARLAVQSGPLMLRQGKMHPAFREVSPNRRLRNAVGVRSSDGQVVFVLSDPNDPHKGRVTFHQFSTFFLHLGCQDALYLDGDISDMLVDPAPGAVFTPNTFATMFVIAE